LLIHSVNLYKLLKKLLMTYIQLQEKTMLTQWHINVTWLD